MYPDSKSHSQKLYDRALKNLPGGNTRTTVFMKPYPLYAALVKAATRQLALGTAFGLPTLSEVELAELLASRLPSVDQVRFANSGTEAVMMALKAARAFTGRAKIAKCEGAYHGSYDYAEVSLDPTPEAWGRNAPVSVAYARGTPGQRARRCRHHPLQRRRGRGQPDPRARFRACLRAGRPDAEPRRPCTS
jgi:glutamate-1-semialdehyde 2,1-aminomutase